MATQPQPVRLFLNQKVNIMWWRAELRMRGPLHVVVMTYKNDRAQNEYVFVLDEAANGREAVYVDDDHGTALSPARSIGTDVLVVDDPDALLREARRQHLAANRYQGAAA